MFFFLRLFKTHGLNQSIRFVCLFQSYHIRMHWFHSCARSITSTHWGRDKMAAIFHTAFWNPFSWMKMYKFRLSFHWSLFPRVQLTRFQYWFRWWLGAGQGTSHYLKQWWFVYWRIYASRGLNELLNMLWSSKNCIVEWYTRGLSQNKDVLSV